MRFIDVSKLVILAYILVVFALDPSNLKVINTPVIISLWIATSVTTFLFIDIVLGFVIALGLVITYVKANTSTKRKRNNVIIEKQNEPKYETKSDDSIKETFPRDMPLQDHAHQAIEKYVVEDYLRKASSDGLLSENLDKFPNVLGEQFNIQGIEKNIVGYNYKY